MAITTLRTTRDFARIWFYWKIPALILFCLIVLSISFYAFTATPMYESSAQLLVLPTPLEQSVVSPARDSRMFLSRPVSDEEINTEIELLRSEAVIDKTISFYQKKKITVVPDEPKTGVDAFFEKFKWTLSPATKDQKKIKNLARNLDAYHILGSHMIAVSLTSPYKDQVSDVLTKLLETYIDHRKHTYTHGDTIAFFESQKQYYSKQLAKANDKLKNFKTQYNIMNLQSQTQASLELIADFQKELKNLEIQIFENQAKIDMIKNGLTIKGSNITLSKDMRSMPVIVELARGLVPLLIKRTEISKTFTKESREYKQIDDQIRMLRQEIKNEIGNATRTDTVELETLVQRRDAIIQKIENLKQESNDYQRIKDEYDALSLDQEIAKTNYIKYGDKKEDSRLFAKRDESNLSNVVIAEAPKSPNRPKSPNKTLAVQVAVVLGLFAALIFPFVLETLDQNIKTSDDVEKILSQPVICTFNES